MSSFEGSREPMEISYDMQQLADKAFAGGQIVTQGEGYEVYALPTGFMDHFVLVLWQADRDFPPARKPAGFEMMVTVNDRQGYLIEGSRVTEIEQQ